MFWWFVANSLTIVAIGKFILGWDLGILAAVLVMKPLNRALDRWTTRTSEAIQARIAEREVLAEAA